MSTRQGLKEPPRGCKIFREAGSLLLDLDTKEAVAQFHQNLALVDESHGVEHVRVWKSRSKGTHAVVRLKSRPRDHELIALQLILGSDPVREYCTLKDLRDCQTLVEHSNVLFKPIGHMERFMAKVYERLENFDYWLRCRSRWGKGPAVKF